jgi:hypothetical protein
MADNDRNGGIIIGGRKVRLELAKNCVKLLVKVPNISEESTLALQKDLAAMNTECCNNRQNKIIPIHRDNSYIVKLNLNENASLTMQMLKNRHPDWDVDLLSDEAAASNTCGGSIAESIQRQSGLFQLLIPQNGVLPVSPATMAKIHSVSPTLQYSLAPIEPVNNVNGFSQNGSSSLSNGTRHEMCPPVMNRLYEDWHESGLQESFQNPADARIAASRLNPPLGDWEGDIFFGRLDNQRVTVLELLERVKQYGEVSFVRLCNRAIVRDDNGTNVHYILSCLFVFVVPVDSTAFVRFASGDAAHKCIKNENGVTWMGRIVKCEKCWNFPGRNTPPISLDNGKTF